MCVSWQDFDFRGHDSAFKDRHLQLQNVRVSFIPTEQADIHDLGPMQEVMTLNFVIFIFFFLSIYYELINVLINFLFC